MYEISGRIIPMLLGRRLLIDLCHPTFAMTGALAWQVNYLMKNNFLGFEEGSHGYCPGSLLTGVFRLLYFSLSVHIMLGCLTACVVRVRLLLEPVLDVPKAYLIVKHRNGYTHIFTVLGRAEDRKVDNKVYAKQLAQQIFDIRMSKWESS